MFEVKKVECDMHQQNGLAGFLWRQVKRKILITGRCAWYLYYFESTWSVQPVSHCNESESIKTFTAMLVRNAVRTIRETSPSSLSNKKEKENCARGRKMVHYFFFFFCMVHVWETNMSARNLTVESCRNIHVIHWRINLYFKKSFILSFA